MKKLLGSLLTGTALLLAIPASASSLLGVVKLQPGQNVNSVDDLAIVFADYLDPSSIVLTDSDLLAMTTNEDTLDGCVFGSDSSCSFDFDDSVKYVTVGAGNYIALYSVGSVVDVNTADWNVVNGGGKAFAPAISNLRSFAVPEPSAAMVFATGTLLVASSIRRRRAS